MPSNTKTYRYFLYSASQYKERLDIEKKIGKIFVPGTVFYQGKKYQFTEMTDDPNKCIYADCKVVAQGYIEDMKYNLPQHKWGASNV